MNREPEPETPVPNILVVEDDENLRIAVSDNLEDAGYDVVSTRTGKKASEYISRRAFDLIVLDINLPDTDGFSLCKQWRSQGTETMILMLTARGQEDDMVEGFAAGADDYIVKPYQLRVFLLRVAALLKRYQKNGGNRTGMSIKLPGIDINREARSITTRKGGLADLTKTEYDLFIYLLDNNNSALTYDDILNSVWGNNIHVVQGAIRNTISAIRKKMFADEQDNWRIVTIRGVGYRFECDE